VDCRRCGQVQTEMLVSIYPCLARIVFVNLPTGTTRNGDQYDAYTRVVMKSFHSEAAVFRQHFAIDSNGLDELI
jgi:hypothetical protein